MRADINVIDVEKLERMPKIVNDLPNSAPRFIQKLLGIALRFVTAR